MATEQLPNPILEVFDFKDYPTLDLGRTCGSTEYIDFIRASDMSHPIMTGVDVFKRPFITIKFLVEFKDDEKPQEMVGTFFQRYTGETSNWAFGTCYESNNLFHDSRVRLDHYAELPSRLSAIKEGKSVHSVDGFKEPYNWVKGNGRKVITLAKA